MREVSIFLFFKITLEKNKYIKYKPANILIKRNFNKKLDNKISNILNKSEIVIPIFKALVLSVEFFKDLDKMLKRQHYPLRVIFPNLLKLAVMLKSLTNYLFDRE